MIGTWLRDVERIKLATVGQGARVVGVVSPLAGAGVSTLARELAEVTARSGKRTILVDLTQGIGAATSPLGWRPSMTLMAASYPATLTGVRGLRTELSKALDTLRLTRAHERDVSLAVSEIAAAVVRAPESTATLLDMRAKLEDWRIVIELTHDGSPVLAESRLAATTLPVVADAPALGLQLASTRLTWSVSNAPNDRYTMRGVRTLVPEPQPAPANPEAGSLARAYDELTATPDKSTKLLFNNVDLIRTVLHSELAAYEAVFVDLPPLLGDADDRLNPLAAAAACDALLLVCVSGEIEAAELSGSMTVLQRAGVSVTGLVLNDVNNPTLGQEMAREARRLERILPSLSGWLSRKALRSRFLDRVSS